jgi:hypothetical protein
MSKKIVTIVGCVAAIIAGIGLYYHPPANYAWYPPCVFKKFTGLDCPGCGSTRACYHLLHGHMLQAANHNILLLFFIPVILIGLLQYFTGKGKRLWLRMNKPSLILGSTLIFWMLRNIPLFPFEWLHSDK